MKKHTHSNSYNKSSSSSRTSSSSRRKPRNSRKRKANKLAGGIFIEALGFFAIIVLFVYARTLTQPETTTMAESPAAIVQTFAEPQPTPPMQTASVDSPQQPFPVGANRPFRVRFGARN